MASGLSRLRADRSGARLLVLSIVFILAVVGVPVGPDPVFAQVAESSTAAQPAASTATEYERESPPAATSPPRADGGTPSRADLSPTRAPRPSAAPRPPGTVTIDRDSLRVRAENGSRVVSARLLAPEQGGRLGVVSFLRDGGGGRISDPVSATVAGSTVRSGYRNHSGTGPAVDVLTIDGAGAVVRSGDVVELRYATEGDDTDAAWTVDTSGRTSALLPPATTGTSPPSTSRTSTQTPSAPAATPSTSTATTRPADEEEEAAAQAEGDERDGEQAAGRAAISPLAVTDTGVTGSNQIPYKVKTIDTKSNPRSLAVTLDRFATLTGIEVGDESSTRTTQLTAAQGEVKVYLNGVIIPASGWTYTYQEKTVSGRAVRYKGVITFSPAINVRQFDELRVSIVGGTANAAGWFVNLKGQLQANPGVPGDPLPPATCTPAGATVWVASANSARSGTQLYRQEQGQSGFAPVGAASPWVYNAVGFNTNDNYLYAVSQRWGSGSAGNPSYPHGQLLQINPNTGSVNPLGPMNLSTGGAYAPTGITTGFFDQDNTFWVSDTNGDKFFYRIDLSTRIATRGVGNNVGLDHAILKQAPGFAWSVSGEGSTVYLNRMNIMTGQLNRWAVTGLRAPDGKGFPNPSTGTNTQAYGTAWTYGNGNLGFGNNGSGQSFQVKITNPTAATPAIELVNVTPAPTSANNDAASNALGSTFNTDLAVTKTRTGTVGGRVQWEVMVENLGPCGTSGFTVVDAVPGGTTGFNTVRIDSSTGALTGGANVNGTTAQVNFGPMGVGERRVIKISALPASTTACVENPVTVTGNESDPDTTNNTATDNWCSLVVTKSVVDVNEDGRIDSQDVYQEADGGQHKITYEIVVRNPAVGNTAIYTLTDTPLFASLVTVKGARVTSDRAGGGARTLTGPGPYNVGNGNVTINKGVTHTYRVDVNYTGPVGNPAASPLAECVSGTERRGLFNRVTMTSGAVTREETACAAVSRPQDVTLLLKKQTADGTDLPLTGAGFAIHEVGADDAVGAKIKDLGELNGGYYSAVLTPGKAYFLVETRSPTGYQLLSQAVSIYIDRDAGENATLEIFDESSDVAAEVSESGTNRDTVVLRVADVRIGALPLTGSSGIGPFALAGAGLLLSALIAALLAARRRTT